MSGDVSQIGMPRDKTGVILVDHGSKVPESNMLLETIAAAYRQHADWSIVEPAHMELAEPSIDTAFGKCVDQGAEFVVVMPYFLGPGRHSGQDIPRLAESAAASHPGIGHLVTAPLGMHDLLLNVVDQRITEAIDASGPS